MVWILRILNIVSVLLGVWGIFYNIEISRISFILLCFLFLISSLRKAFILGFDNLRGRFWILLSLNGLFFPISELFYSKILHLISRFYLTFTLAFMLVGLLKQGLELKGKKTIIWLFGLIVSISLSFIFSIYLKTTIDYLFLIVLNLNFAILLANVLLYLGSDLGKRWLLGFLAFSFFFVGDPLYLLNNQYHYFFWSLIFFFMNMMSYIEE
ncbi:MAG: hypothetical protein ABIL76_00740 [candidate division WOR-3 bacterium]